MEKIKILNGVVKKLDLTPETVIKNWFENGTVSSDFLQSLCGAGEVEKSFAGIKFIPSKKFITPKNVEPGMFYYADGLIFPELIKDNQVSAIVGCVEKKHGLAMGLRETDLPWSSNWLEVDMPAGISGKEATKLILRAAQRHGKKAETAEWCASYAFDGIKAGTMFEPSKEELKRIFVNYRKLREPFSALELKGLQEDRFYWSSSEYGNTCYAWVVNPSGGYMETDYKDCSYPVRCVLAFKF